MELYRNKTFDIYILSFVIISLAFTGLISYLAVLYDAKIFKLWKEIYVIFFIVCFILTIYKKKITFQESILFLVTGAFYCIYISYNILAGIPQLLIFYQIKNDVIVIFFALILYSYLNQYNRLSLEDISRRIVKYIIYLGLINAVFGVLQELFYETFLNFVDFNGAWGASIGIMLFISNDTLRPIGLQMGFVPYATLCLLTLILVCENKLYIIQGKKRYIIIAFLSFAVLYSHYITATLGWIIYFLFYIIRSAMNSLHFSKKDSEHIIYILYGILFIFMFFATNDYTIHNFASEFFPEKANTSIGPRVMTHLQILDDIFSNWTSTFFGAGFGIYGAYTLDTSALSSAIGSVATDSTYSYLLGNYGFVTTLLYIFLFVVMIYKNGVYDYFGVKTMLLYALTIELFFNNLISDFPINYLLIILVAINMKLIRMRSGCDRIN